MRIPSDVDDCGTGGGGGGSITVQDDGVTVVAPATTLNFTGDVVVTDAGGGVADIAIGGGSVQRFKVAVGALTDPDGFDITIPVPMLNTNYVVNVTALFPTVDDATEYFLLAIVDTNTFTMGALANFADGTILHISVGQAT